MLDSENKIIFINMLFQIIFTLAYLPFVILIATSCVYEGKTAKVLKITSYICGTVAVISYFYFIKNIIYYRQSY